MDQRSAGRPASPTLHPRTRPEANEIALKHRGTNDWFRHDGKNVEVEPPPPQRLQGYVAPEVAEKAKGEPEKWFQHDPNNPTDPQPKPRVPSEEAKKTQTKVEGKDEAWYKTEENQDYYSERPKPRVTTVQGQECLEKLGKANTNEWFKHEHGKGEDYTPPPNKSRTGPMPYAGENRTKMQGKGTPDWYRNDGKEAPVESDDRPHSRVHTQDAQEYLDRNRGSASNWYQHNNKGSSPAAGGGGGGGGDSSAQHTPRATRPKTADSENWFNHDSNKAYVAPKPAAKAPSPAAKASVEKSRGQSMEKALVGSATPTQPKAPRVKNEASGNAQKNQGMMSKYLNQDANKGYQSSRPGGRVVKNEASVNAQRNQGSLGDSLGGNYPESAPAKREQSRVKPEAAQNAQRNKGSMNSIMGASPSASSPRPASRMKPEAQANYDRNRGQGFNSLIGSVDNMQVNDRPQPRIGSASARAAADRNKGSIGSLLGMG